MDNEYGGYSYRFIDADLPDKYSCAICTFVARDPQQVICCSHIYCKSCLLKHEQISELSFHSFNCPSCRQDLYGRYFPDGRIEREIKDLGVYCPNDECQWKGIIKDIETHITAECPYQSIECSNGCGENLQRMEMETHVSKECPKRIVTCTHCEVIGVHEVISTDAHLDVCPFFPITCTNDECDVISPRNQLSAHKRTCPKSIVTCEYSSVGCSKRMKLEVQEDHNESFVKEHLQLAVNALKNRLPSNSKVLKLRDFNNKKSKDEKWYSSPFYTSPGGYKMILSVCANGNRNAKGTHVSCYIHLVRGENDDYLEWPFQGEVTIELLNQLEDNNHKAYILKFNESTPDNSKNRVVEQGNGCGWGFHRFVSHSELGHITDTNCCYLLNDCLHFRITVNATYNKPWLL
ncbi:PREDICTED: TNF receptor-associated factor 5-like [Amphimedon queenslandica]|uniref:RING-type E3 ubiquitin transferase n=1 Tax=Amphimedon queenslandica TaxID=400682 RepID=A0A1X7UYD4_AMPQE|nr:PREDICTED: TNF receptor-associated factor 5-like [Amphimedon queenslandica]|eukprot:XP_011403822.1 PREDICTED: TNF receptor-associated factor 5-like [Amphimedon queenslandica]